MSWLRHSDTRDSPKPGSAPDGSNDPTTPQRVAGIPSGPVGVIENRSQDSFIGSSTPQRLPGHGHPGGHPNGHGPDRGLDHGPTMLENVLMQKRLVEQFYKMDGKTKPRLLDALASVFGASAGASAGAAVTGPLHDPKKPLLRTIFPELVAQRYPLADGPGANANGASISPFDDGTLQATDALELLTHLGGQNGGIELEEMATTLQAAVLSLERELRFLDPLPSGQKQLQQTEDHLTKVKKLVGHVADEVDADITAVKSLYHDQMQQSMEKITRLRELLGNLGDRVDAAKSKMGTSRALMATEMAGKIAVLENVAARFDEHDQKVRQRRGRQAVMALALVAVVLAVFMAIKR